MNRTYNAVPMWVRSVLAIAAVASTSLIVSAIEGLALHYEASVATPPPSVIAQR